MPPYSKLSLVLLALAIAGCSAPFREPFQQHGNPFDEVRAPRHVDPKPRSAPKSMPMAKPAIQSAAKPADVVVMTAPVGAGIQVMPAGGGAPDLATTPLSASPIPAAGSGVPQPPATQADQLYAEAMRMGAAGDGTGKLGKLEQAAGMGSADALYELAKVYQQDTVVAKDINQSVTYLSMALGRGHKESARVLGMLYLTGQGVAKDTEYGTMLLEDAAKTSVRAMREYGQLLTNQRQPHLNNPTKGIKYLQDAVAHGDSEAAAALSKAQGRSVDTLNQKPSQPMTKATQGEPSQVPASKVGALTDLSAEALKQRAFSGDVDAIYTYALNVANRKLPSVQPEFEAYCWYSAAATLGNKKAAQELEALQGLRTQMDQKEPGRIDECVNGVLEVVAQ